jgi:hypothetical protein
VKDGEKEGGKDGKGNWIMKREKRRNYWDVFFKEDRNSDLGKFKCRI